MKLGDVLNEGTRFNGCGEMLSSLMKELVAAIQEVNSADEDDWNEAVGGFQEEIEEIVEKYQKAYVK